MAIHTATRSMTKKPRHATMSQPERHGIAQPSRFPVRTLEPAPPLGRTGRAVRDEIAGTLTTLIRVEEQIVFLVRSAIATSLGAAGTVADELASVVRDVVAGALEATEQVGTGLVVGSKSIAKGVVLGVHDAGGDIAKAAAETVNTIIQHAGAAGADIRSVARRTVDGVVEATTTTGEDVGHVARAAVKGAIKTASKLGTKSARMVTDVLAGIAQGFGQRADISATTPARLERTKSARKAGATARKITRPSPRTTAKKSGMKAVKRATKR